MKRNQYMDIFQTIICAIIAGSFLMLFVLVFLRLMFLDNLEVRKIVDIFISVDIDLQLVGWVWFIARSITYRMRLKEAMKEEEDINIPSQN